MKEIFQLSNVEICENFDGKSIVSEDENLNKEEEEEEEKRIKFDQASSSQCARCRLYNITPETETTQKSEVSLCKRCS